MSGARASAHSRTSLETGTRTERHDAAAGWTGWLLAGASVLALAGLGIATYLTVVHYAGEPIVCSGVGDCELVNSSRYAEIAGVPVAALGAASYVSILVLTAVAGLRRSATALMSAWGIALASFAFSMYLTYIEVRVLDAICVWCVASACVMTALFALLSIALWLANRQTEALSPPHGWSAS